MNIRKLGEVLKRELDAVAGSANKNAALALTGFEGVDAVTAEAARESASTVESAIEAAFETIELEGGKIPEHVAEAAKKAALYATATPEVIKTIVKNRSLPEVGNEAVVIDATIFDGDDISAGFEAFDGQNVKPSVFFTVLYNTMVMQQDPVVELFFPIIPVDPKSAGATVTAVIDSVIKEVTRSIDGAVNKTMFDKTPLVKIVNDPEKIDVDKNRLVPVYRTQSADKFVDALRTVVNYNGESVTTAPLKVGQEVNLLGISQTDSMLARGTMDETDALDANVKITALYSSLTGKDSEGNEVTEYFKHDLSQLPAFFTYSTRDHSKDLILTFSSEDLAMIAGETKTATGADSQILGGLPEGYTAKLKLVMSGSGNTQYGDISVYVNEFRLVQVIDAAGNIVDPTTEVYGQFEDVFKTLKAEGFEVEAYLTNTNARMRGLLVTADVYTEVFTVPYRTGITVQLPVVINGDDGDATYLNTQINATRAKMNMSGFKVLTGLIDYLRTAKTIDVKMTGVSDKLVNKWFDEQTLDLTQLVDSINSNTRDEDIRKALVLKIKNAATRAFLESNYGIALSTLRPDLKPTIIIGTDPVIGQFLLEDGGIANDAQFNYEIRTSANPLIRGKVVFSFGVFDDARNKEPNPLNFGQCFWSPELVINVLKTVNGATRTELTTMPRYRHVPNLPVIGVFNITNIDAVLGKVPVQMKTV